MAPRTRADELVVESVNSIVATAPREWARIVVTVKATVLAYEFTSSILLPGGTFADAYELPADAKDAFEKLRAAHYEEGRGTWFSARVAIDRGESPQISFNRDEDPQWSPPLEGSAFVRDLEEFPRTAENVPDWLRRNLDEHNASST